MMGFHFTVVPGGTPEPVVVREWQTDLSHRLRTCNFRRNW